MEASGTPSEKTLSMVSFFLLGIFFLVKKKEQCVGEQRRVLCGKWHNLLPPYISQNGGRQVQNNTLT